MTHDEIWDAIEKFATDKQLSCSGLAKKSGLDATTFNRSKRFSREGQPRWPNMHSIAKILTSTGCEISEFTKYLLPKTRD